MEGRPTGGRFNRPYRITFRVWTAIVVAGDLALFFALPAWDNSTDESFVSNTGIFVAVQLFAVIVWAVGLGFKTSRT